nr:MAG TPA: hypothetical protein [Caudoviricetes sp.]
MPEPTIRTSTCRPGGQHDQAASRRAHHPGAQHTGRAHCAGSDVRGTQHDHGHRYQRTKTPLGAGRHSQGERGLSQLTLAWDSLLHQDVRRR